MPPTKPIPTGLKLFLWFFIGIGVLAICFGINLAFQSIRCGSWPTAEGTIRTSAMGRHRGNKGGTTYSADVSYDYAVLGSHYTGTKVAFGMMSASSGYARGVLDRYPVGAKIPVHYSLSNPETAVLETGMQGGTWICFGVGTIFALFGIMFLQLAKRQPEVNRTAPAGGTDRTRINAPQILFGVILVLFGIFPILTAHTSGSNAIIMYVVGGVFCFVGLHIMTYRPETVRLSRFFSVAISLMMLGIFNWIAFDLGRVNGRVDMFAGVIVGFLDLMFLLVAAGWLFKCFKRLRVKARRL
jgi:hypothetical protein